MSVMSKNYLVVKFKMHKIIQRRIILCLCGLLLSTTSLIGQSQIDVDQSSSGDKKSTKDLTINHTVSAGMSNTVVVVSLMLAASDTSDIDLFTYEGQSLNFEHSIANNGRILAIYTLINPPVGTNKIKIKLNNKRNISIGATGFANVEQSNIFSSIQNKAGQSTNLATVFDCNTEGLVVDFLVLDGNIGTPDVAQDLAYSDENESGDEVLHSSSKQAVSGNDALDWSFSNAEYNYIYACMTLSDPCDPASGNIDTDSDGITDICDPDDDNDGILDVDEIIPLTELPFDGVVDYAQINNSPINGLNEYTISFWFKSDAALITDYSQTFVMGQKGLLEIFISDWSSDSEAQTINAKYFKSNGLAQSSGWKFRPESWVHFTVTVKYTPGFMEIIRYRNGYASGSTVIPSTSNSNSNPFRFGRINGSSYYDKFQGAMDEVRIFNKVLTDTQIRRMIYQEIYNESGKVRGTIIDKDISDEETKETIDWNDLIRYYPMQTMSGTTLKDESNAGEDATLYSISSFQPQTAPMPYESVSDGDWTEESTWLHGDKWDIENLHVYFPDGTGLGNQSPEPWSIVKIHNDVTSSRSHRNLGLFIDPNKRLTVNGDNSVKTVGI